MGSYSIVDHTADIGIAIEAPSLEDLFETAATALFEILSDTATVAPRQRWRIQVRGTDREELLVAWLSELLYLHDADRVLLCRFNVESITETNLIGVAEGEEYDPGRHRIATEIKAVTHHQISVRLEESCWRARVVLDV